MAVDKLVDSAQLDADLTSVANAIRTKGGTSADLAFPADFVSAIAAIPSGGGTITKEEGTFTGNGSATINFPVARQQSPDIVIVMRSDYENMTPVTDRANCCTVGAKPGLVASTYAVASSTTLSNGGCYANTSTDWRSTPNPNNNQISFVDNKLYIKSGNNQNLWSTSLTYKYTLIFLS